MVENRDRRQRSGKSGLEGSFGNDGRGDKCAFVEPVKKITLDWRGVLCGKHREM